jgi:hypothetical protein
MEIGDIFTRQEINERFGGGVRQMLPTVKKRVVCVCLQPSMNPASPKALYIGSNNKGRVTAAAEQWNSEKQAVPLFHARGHGKWEFLGYFRACRLSRDSSEIKNAELDSNRFNLDRILYLEEIQV